MKIERYHINSKLNTQRHPCVLAIGNFDGIHRGHKQLINRALKIASDEKLQHCICTFEPPPDCFFNRDVPRLNNLRTKISLLCELSVQQVMIIPFRPPYCEMSPQDFIAHFLVREMNVKHLISGRDFHFGKERNGNAATLTAAADTYGFSYHKLDDFPSQAERISSTEVRERIEKGNFQEVQKTLGHPYRIIARVGYGSGLGKKLLATPTANLVLGKCIPPLNGVYATRVRLADKTQYMAVTNCGVKPTVDGKKYGIETHLFHFSQSLYGQTISVEFVERLRSEQRFNHINDLAQQIQKDKELALKILSASENHSNH